MTGSSKTLFKKPDGAYLLWLFAFIFLTPWAIILSQLSINSNSAWLLICAQRLMDGGSMLHDCYDTNPPLSILIHFPHVFLAKVTQISAHDWMNILGFALCLLGAGAVQYYLRKLEWLDARQSAIMGITFLATLCITSGYNFADRDHLVAMLFVPFLLQQICLTQKIKTNRLLCLTILIIGSWLFLVKPYYGLMPTILLLQRFYTDKSALLRRVTNIILSPDFLALAASTLAYLSIIALWHMDYVTNIVPDVITLYSPYALAEWVYPPLYKSLGVTALCIVFYVILCGKNNLSLILILTGATLNGLLAFTLQKKGFNYHLFPAHSALALLICLLMLACLKNFATMKIAQHFLTGASLTLLIFLLAYAYRPPNGEYTTHTWYQNNILSEKIAQHCGADCAFFMTYDNMDIVAQLAYYNNLTYASRFPTFWFTPMTHEKLTSSDTPHEERQHFKAIKRKYHNYVAEDIKRYNPQMLILIRDPDCPFRNHNPDHGDILPPLMENYHIAETIEVDRAIFYRNTRYDFPHIITWDIFVRTDLEKSSADTARN